MYAARAYLALLQLGTGEARGVSELAGIPTAKVYGTLTKLQRAGLVHVSPGKPRQYSAAPMGDFLAQRIREQEAEIRQLRASADEISSLFPLVGTAVATDRARTTTILGRRNIAERLREACAEAHDRILVLMSPDLRHEVSFQRFFEQAAARGVAVHSGQQSGSGEDATQLLVATFDDARAIMVSLAPEPGAGGKTREIAFHTTEPGFVRMFQHAIASRSGAQVDTPRNPAAHRVDVQVLEAHVDERVARRPLRVTAVLPPTGIQGAERDLIWRALDAAQHARVLVGRRMDGTIEPELLAGIPAHAEAKVLSKPSTIAVVVLDDDHAFFVAPEKSVDQADPERYAITTSTSIVRAFGHLFEERWIDAQTLRTPDRARRS